MEDFPYPDAENDLRLLSWEEQRAFKSMAMGMKEDPTQGGPFGEKTWVDSLYVFGILVHDIIQVH